MSKRTMNIPSFLVLIVSICRASQSGAKSNEVSENSHRTLTDTSIRPSHELFDWRAIDKLEQNKTLPILRRVKRQGETILLDDHRRLTQEKIANSNSPPTKPNQKGESSEVRDRIYDEKKRLETELKKYTEIVGENRRSQKAVTTINSERMDLPGYGGGDPNQMKIGVALSVEGVNVTVDDSQIYSNWKNYVTHQTSDGGELKNRHHSGVHILVLDAITGRLLRATSHTTWQLSSVWMVEMELKKINRGRLLVVIGVPDFMKHFTSRTDKAQERFRGLGSQFINFLVEDEAFVMISKSEGGVYSEYVRTKLLPQKNLQRKVKSWRDGPPMIVETFVQRKNKSRCEKSDNLSGDHLIFCEKYEGYGLFCNCSTSLESYLPKENLSNTSLPLIGVVLVGGRRLPQVLDQVVMIRSNTGGQTVPMVITMDGYSEEATMLAKLLNVRIEVGQNILYKKGTAARVNYMIQWSVTTVFAVFPEIEFAIIIEDDLQLAPDFMPYFRQLTHLAADLSEFIFCVNAYSYNSFPETTSDYSRMYRHDSTCAYGWMITRDVGREISEYDGWPDDKNKSDWDYYIRKSLYGRRDVLSPEVPRSRHVGGGGVHASGLEQEVYFNRRTFNDKYRYVKMDIEGLSIETYLENIFRDIKRAVFLDLYKTHPCDPTFFDGHPANSSFKMYIDMEHSESDPNESYSTVMKCLGSNDRAPVEHLKLMYHFHYFKKPIYLIVCPTSAFCLEENSTSLHYIPSAKDIQRSNTFFFKKLGMDKTVYSYRMNTDVPHEDFMLLNSFEVYTSNLYYIH